MSEQKEHPEHPVHVFHYSVDTEQQTTTEAVLTPTQILQHAGVDPSNHYLVQIKGKEKISYQDKPNQPIEMHDGMKFISVSTKPTPVS